MNLTIHAIDKQLNNLFPATITQGAIDIFGNQAMQPVLLRLLAAPAPAAGSPQVDADVPFRHLLHPKEAALLSGYRFTKRRSEYLTGRICAKMAIQSFLQQSTTPALVLKSGDIEIASTVSGRPDVRVHAAHAEPLKMDISISHSGDYGVALVTGSTCGIDLQLRQAGLVRVQEKYCAVDEHKVLAAFLPNHEPLTRLALLWTAKEAAKKALSYWQMVGFLDLQVTELKNLRDAVVFCLRIRPEGNRHMPEEVCVVAGLFGDYALAICLVNEDRNHAGTARS
ncbi:4'-phosphopantetheinyl transferase superfamily protein [Desulfocastanea catecholica]